MNFNIQLAKDLMNISKVDLLAAISLVHGEKGMGEIQYFLLQAKLLTKSNFANALINWGVGTDPILMRQSALECLKDQYPELYEQLRSDYGNDV